MPLLAVLDEGAHGALDESLKSLYVQNTETKQFYLDVSPDEAGKLAFNLQKQLDAKKADLQRVHGEKTAISTKLKAYEDLSLTPEQVTELRDSKRPEDIQKLVEAHKTEIDQLKKSYEEPLSKKEEELSALRSEQEQTLVASAIQKARNDLGLNSMADYVLPHYLKTVRGEDGKAAVKVFENGEEALVAGQPKSIEQLVNSFREGKTHQEMFVAGEGGGTGATNRQTTFSNGKIFTVDYEASKTNPELYRTAKAEADKVGGQIQWTGKPD